MRVPIEWILDIETTVTKCTIQSRAVREATVPFTNAEQMRLLDAARFQVT